MVEKWEVAARARETIPQPIKHLQVLLANLQTAQVSLDKSVNLYHLQGQSF